MPSMQIEKIWIDHEEIRGADYSGRKLYSFGAEGSRFERCNFERTRIESSAFGVGMEMSKYIDCSFDGATLGRGGGYVHFERCSFRKTRLTIWSADYVEFVDCVFTGKISSMVFWGKPPPGAEQRYAWSLRALERQGKKEPLGYRDMVFRAHNEFRGNDFSGTELRDVSFKAGVDLNAQLLPTGPDYLYLPDAESAVLRALATLGGRSVDPLRAQIERFLRILLAEIATGQQQLLLRTKDFQRRGVIPDYVTEAVELLKRE